jgi:prepilin-type N-terminal cleavage/methylation domain-containing protein/prepilin-type processing-associated H-X9-DG protein
MEKLSSKMKKMNCKQNAFTLMELLAVIGIIALLMGIVMPALDKVRGMGRRTVCESNLHNIGIAFVSYLNDNDEVMPPAINMPSLKLYDPNTQKPITDYLLSYLSGSKKVFCCPADVGRQYFNTSDPNNANEKYFEKEGSSYWYNTMVFRGNVRISETRIVKEFHVSPKEIAVLYDYAPFHSKGDKVKVSDGPFWGEDGGTVEAGGKNYLYADWHVNDYKNK